MNKILNLFSNIKFSVTLVILFSVLASIQAITHHKKHYVEGGPEYTEYNNYMIFKHSYFNLKNDKDLYIEHVDQYFDLYKYSPTFSVFFGVFAYFPDSVGLTLWNILNALALIIGVYLLPKLDTRKKSFILLLCLLELLTSMQNEQSNGLIAGLIVLSLSLLERKHYFFAVFCIAFSVYIKLFGIVAIALFILYPQKGKLALYTVFWFVLLFLIPLIFVDLEHYKLIFESWGEMLSNDHSTSHGYSLMGWLQTWFGLNPNKLVVVVLGAMIFCLPLIRIKLYAQENFKLLMLSSILIWIVIFNHKAESPTFIIAFAGISIWYYTSVKNKINLSLFILAFVFTCLSPTDLFPKFIRKDWFEPFAIKAVPCIIIWFKIVYDLMTIKVDSPISQTLSKNEISTY